MDSFELTLHRTYYEKGFFNVPVACDGRVRSSEGEVELVLGASGKITGKVYRTANTNGTARIWGGVSLRDWFQRHFAQGAIVHVEFTSLSSIRLHHPQAKPTLPTAPDPTPKQPLPRDLVGRRDLTDWRYRLVQLVSTLEGGSANSDPIGRRIAALVASRRIPRHTSAAMKVITEMRNASEYQNLVLTPAESTAVSAAWQVVVEWAARQGIPL